MSGLMPRVYALAADREEPERYELREGPRYRFSRAPLDATRREFLASLGAGIVIASLASARGAAQETAGKFPTPPAAPDDISAWLHIGPDGRVTVFTGKVEFGQNARTSLTQAVAEELGAPLEAIELVMGDTDRTPWDQGTVGSATTPNMVPQLRRAAAAARKLLPAEDWQGTDFKRIATGTLQRGPVKDATLHPTTAWTVMGTSVKKVGGADFVTGRHQYVSDMTVPGMRHGKVVRPEMLGGRLATFDGSGVSSVADARVVRDGDFVGVVADSVRNAQLAARAVKATWTADPQTSSATLFEDLRGGVTLPADPELERALAASAHRLDRTYTLPYIAHVPLEPRAAIATWDGPKLTVWVGTQRPFNVRAELAEAFGVAEANIRVLVPDTGSGYGGKHTGEVALEAARLAKAAGAPVKLVWTREEEFTWGYFRPAGTIDVRGGIDSRGMLTAWDFHNYNSGRAAIQPLYDIPHKRVEYHVTKNPLRQGSYRGLAATGNHFARESHMDQLAALAGLDPLEFRLSNISDPRLRAVLEAVAAKFGWGARKPAPGTGFGIACGFEKGGYVATCAEVTAVKGAPPKVLKLTEVFECGAVINPEHIHMQIEGCIVMGLGGALYESIDFADGRILNPRLSRYRVPRFGDIPEIEITTLDRRDLPSAGASETPLVCVAPAIAGAVAQACGDRRLSMPFK